MLMAALSEPVGASSARISSSMDWFPGCERV